MYVASKNSTYTVKNSRIGSCCAMIGLCHVVQKEKRLLLLDKASV